jgi:peptide deformylase
MKKENIKSKIPPIVQKGEKVLEDKALPIKDEEFGSPKINEIIKDMRRALHSQVDGIAIAAPQIGIAKKIFIINGDLLSQADATYDGPKEDLVFINPKILKLSKEKRSMEEGCLSVRWKYGVTKRSVRATISYRDEKGVKKERGGSGIMAQIFQHEIEHLDGVLFTDHAEEVWDMSKEEIEEIERRNNGIDLKI